MSSVRATTHISFDADTNTFSLYAGNSLYAFAISPELGLEHLYWGPRLHEGFDLRYLDCNAKQAPFTTFEHLANVSKEKVNVPGQDSAEDVIDAYMSLEDLHENWKRNKLLVESSTEDYQMLHHRRMENLAWRLMRLKEQNTATPSSSYSDHVEPTEPFSFNKANLSDANPRITPIVSQSDLQTVLPKTSSYQIFNRGAGEIGRGMLLTEFSDNGTGDFRNASFLVECDNGSTITPLRYFKHEIYNGNLPMPDYFPHIRVDMEDCSTLVVYMRDAFSELEVQLVYVTVHSLNAIIRRTVFTNTSKKGMKVIHKANSLTVDLPAIIEDYHLVHLSGSWARERHQKEMLITHGIHRVGSSRGVSSHEHNPYIAITHGAPHESSGEVCAFAFVYSGNFLMDVEMSEMGNVRVNVGIHPSGFGWKLEEGAQFHTPETVIVRSSSGLGGTSRTMHRLINDYLLPKTWAMVNPPIIINTWEALYYNVNHTNVMQLAQQAIRIGANLLVLDDGWFGERIDDNSSLGDWSVNKDKFPLGLKELATQLNNMDMKFGIWIEPEMISQNSNLYREHPEWCLHVPGRVRQVGKNQLVLDIGNPLIRDYIYEQLHALLSSANIEYVKWDMNRPLTEVYSQQECVDDEETKVPKPFQYSCSGYQPETSHRYMLGVYELLYKITKAFPHVLLETCAAGGGRFDLGMLFFSPQIWTSDNTDVLARMKIQYGTMLAYPARCIGTHISSVPNHITGDTSRLRTRAFVAMSGTFGFELDIRSLSIGGEERCRKYSDMFKSIYHIVHNGDLYRLWNPFKVKFAAWMFVSRSKRESVVFAFSNNSDHWNRTVPTLKLQGLLPDGEYEISEPFPNNLYQQKYNLQISRAPEPVYQLRGYSKTTLSGDILMRAGLPLRFYTLDDSLMFLVTQVVPNIAALKSSPSAMNLHIV